MHLFYNSFTTTRLKRQIAVSEAQSQAIPILKLWSVFARSSLHVAQNVCGNESSRLVATVPAGRSRVIYRTSWYPVDRPRLMIIGYWLLAIGFDKIQPSAEHDRNTRRAQSARLRTSDRFRNRPTAAASWRTRFPRPPQVADFFRKLLCMRSARLDRTISTNLCARAR